MSANDYWERAWQRDADCDFSEFAAPYYRMNSREIELFRDYGIRDVCDAGCGFGAHSLAYASNGFSVTSFDISETAVNIAKRLMMKYGLEPCEIKTASILETGYRDGAFDGAISYSVIDHMTLPDAKRALRELLRITRAGGLVLLAVDSPDADDLRQEHLVLADGSIQYTAGSRRGMILHPYDADALDRLLAGERVIHRNIGPKGELIAIIRKDDGKHGD